MPDNLALAIRAWSKPTRGADLDDHKSGDYRTLYDYLAEDVTFRFTCPEDTPRYGGDFVGKSALIDLFKSECQFIDDCDWERPPEFVSDGDMVVLLGAERYKIKNSGVSVRNNEIAIAMNFKDGLIHRMSFIMDLSDMVEDQRDLNGPQSSLGGQFHDCDC